MGSPTPRALLLPTAFLLSLLPAASWTYLPDASLGVSANFVRNFVFTKKGIGGGVEGREQMFFPFCKVQG